MLEIKNCPMRYMRFAIEYAYDTYENVVKKTDEHNTSDPRQM